MRCRLSLFPLHGAEFSSKFRQRAMHIVQFGARGKAVLFAEMLDQLVLCHPQLGRRTDQRCLGLQERF